ncbi:hypothetical protein MINT15_33560 [Saccharomonospora viridis]|uniref:Uncharacterized protein n=1 Tax=Saccharomonospora viridis TaxID=1852 RepID=A0A837D9T0_9PSEU|nr:hypothetical protein MINT15_33560 [Saccharomonospora viridis]
MLLLESPTPVRDRSCQGGSRGSRTSGIEVAEKTAISTVV